MKNACITLALAMALAAAGPLLSGCGDAVDGPAVSSSSSSSSSGGSSTVSALTPNFESVPADGGSTPAERAQTLASFAGFGLLFASTSAPSKSRQVQPISYTVDSGNGYSTSVTITPPSGTSLETKVDYEVKPTAGGAAIYTGSYTISVSTTGSFTYNGTASWNLPAPANYSGTSTTSLSGTTAGSLSGTVTATSGDITVNLNIAADGSVTGDAKQGGTVIGTYGGSTTTGITFTAS